jgi:peroxiredoxin/tetratricopeptide (TPR) repeat protein
MKASLPQSPLLMSGARLSWVSAALGVVAAVDFLGAGLREVRADGPAAGHSSAGEAFNEGPRQAATLLEREAMGRVNFPVSTASELAQRYFNQGVAQLHGFWFYEAERSFRQVLKVDPQCAMAYWGLAVANRHNPKRAREFLEKAKPLEGRLTDVEKRWLEAYRAFFGKEGDPSAEARRKLVEVLEGMAFDFPADLEVKVALVLHAWENSFSGVPVGSREALDAVLREVLAVEPWHPGAHHLRIHLWYEHDDRRALGSAAVVGQSGTGVAHLWHMAGHTFSGLKRYGDAAWQQEASARTDHAWMLARGLMPDQIHNYAHNNDWLVSNLGYVGRVEEAISLAKNMVELPQLAPKTEVIGRRVVSDERSSFAMGSRRLVEILGESERWAEMVTLESTVYLQPREEAWEEALRLQGLVAAYAGLGRVAEAEERLGKLEAAVRRVKEQRYEAAEEAEAKARKESKKAEEAFKQAQEVLKQKRERVDLVDAWLAAARMDVFLAKGQIDEAAVRLLEAKKLSPSRKAYAQWAVGNRKEALQTAQEAVQKDGAQVFPLAALADLLWREGRKEEAAGVFERLRLVGKGADLRLPAFVRLEGLRRELGIPEDWRLEGPPVKDVGVRPPLSSLGPFRWEPQKAPAWGLPTEKGAWMRSLDWRGKPIVLMFYLGSGCSHCIQQLNLFAPWHEAYQKAGIELLAVSVDSQADLHKTMTQAKGGSGYPFPILADPELAAFRMFRAYDDFEQQPLHGVFLIDGEGLLRWQNISFQPFEQPEWLLKECQRLLKLKG